MALVLGAQVYRGVEFNELEEPDDDHESSGWRMSVNPTNHPVNLHNIDVLIGAEGKRVTIPGNAIYGFMNSSSYAYMQALKERNFEGSWPSPSRQTSKIIAQRLKLSSRKSPEWPLFTSRIFSTTFTKN